MKTKTATGKPKKPRTIKIKQFDDDEMTVNITPNPLSPAPSPAQATPTPAPTPTPVVVEDLCKRAMLVKMTVSQWTARRYDKNVSEVAATEFDADKISAGRFNKLLVAEDAIKTIQKQSGGARMWHYANTLPWSEEYRLLPVANYDHYSKNMAQWEAQFTAAVSTFVNNYPILKDAAKTRLGKMFKEADYPQPAVIASKFAFSVHYLPVPEAGDFRVDIDKAHVAKIQADLESRLLASQTLAMKDLWLRLYDVVTHMHERLTEQEPIFRDSLIQNIKEIVAILPRLNVACDPNLEKMRLAAEQLCSYAPVDLRNDSSARASAVKEAEQVRRQMEGFMQISGFCKSYPTPTPEPVVEQ